MCQRFVEPYQPCLWLTKSSMGFRQERQPIWSSYLCSRGTQGAQALLDLRDPFLRLSLLHQRPATQDRTDCHPLWKSLGGREANGGFGAFQGETHLTAQYVDENGIDEGRAEAVGVCQVLRQGQRLIDPRQPLPRIAQQPEGKGVMA